MKKIKTLLFLLFLVIIIPINSYAFSVSAEYACLLEPVTGNVLFEKNAYEPYPMASTTKIMTALTAMEHSLPDETVSVSAHAASQEGSSAYLRSGDTLRMKDLLYGLMLNSGNDAAMAIAEHISGNAEAFAQLMTQRASLIGAEKTCFKNPSGLDEAGHYTTAYDLSLITAAAMRLPAFREIVSTKTKQVTLTNGNLLYFHNHNKLLTQYHGAIGVKTGYTKAVGRCLVSAAERDGIELIAVTLNAPNDWSDHKSMLDYGFETLSLIPVVTKGQQLKAAEVKGVPYRFVAAQTVELPLPDSRAGDVSVILHMPEKLSGPINEAEKVGWAEIRFQNRPAAQVDIIAADSIPTFAAMNFRRSVCSVFLETTLRLFR